MSNVLTLAYHAVTPTWSDALAVKPDTFRLQLQRLAERGYRGVTFSGAALAHPREPIVAITFDDAFASVAEWAAPTLKDLGWPATVFAVTTAVESGEPMWWLSHHERDESAGELKPLTWAQLSELAASGWEIGSHSRSHRLLTHLSEEDLTEEVAGSRTDLIERIGSCTSFSYPWGILSPRAIDAVERAGYTAASGLAGRFLRHNRLAVPRFAISAQDGAVRFRLKTSGTFGLVRSTPLWDIRRPRRSRPVPAVDMRRALVLDGQSGPALAVARSLGRAGWEVTTQAGTRTARSRYTRATYEIPDSSSDPDGFVRALASAIREQRPDVIVPCTDASVSLLWQNETLLDGARVLGAGRDSAALCLDKASALAAADAHGFPTPKWLAPSSFDEAFGFLDEIGLPAVVKPTYSYVRDGSVLKQRRHIVLTKREDLPAALDALQGSDSALPLLQEYVPGRALAVSAVLHDGRVLGMAARETLSFAPVSGGTSVWKRTIPPDEPGVAAALELLRRLGYEGLAEIEYQVPRDGIPRLMEIGVRAHGWIGLAVAAGVDLPLIAASALVGDDVEQSDTYRVGLEMRWLAGELSRVKVALSRRPVLPPDLNRRRVVASAWPPWRFGMRYDGIELSDLRPWLPRGFRRPRAFRGA